MNVVVDDLGEDRYCRNIAVVHQLQMLKPGSDRIPVVLWNLSSRALKLRKGTSVAHVEISQVVPPLDGFLEKEIYMEGLQKISCKKINLKIHLKRMMKEY